MKICMEEKCTGCAACENICPTESISMMADDKGFFRPAINEHTCISCRKCKQVCPQNNMVNTSTRISVFAALARMDTLREESSSGGVFSLLAEQTLRKGGVVFGAAYDENLMVKHIAVTDTLGLAKLRGSKYVQSQVGHTYQDAKRYLDNGKAVLFSGTPCQIAGLRAFLGKSYANLLTIDLLCHGVPSPAVYHMYTDNLQSKYSDKIVDIRFRSKKPGWKNYSTQVILAGGDQINLSQDPYMDGFLRDLYLRESCYQCPYASSNRVGDITLGDYWGYQESWPHYLEDDDCGLSLMIVNTPIGRSAYKSIKKKLAAVPRTIEDAKRGNKVLSGSFSKPTESERFWQCYHECSWEQLCDIFTLRKNAVCDTTIPENRAYEAQPFCKRHPRHVLGRYKGALLRKLRGK